MIRCTPENGTVAPPQLIRNPRSLVLLALSLLISHPLLARQSAPDSLWTVDMQTVVVTATRSPSILRDVPIPTRVIDGEKIEARGSLRLSDLLAEEPGLMLTHFLGTGIQLQGLDADYTLILIDGQPVIGRSGGTLDLDRFPVHDIESVEIVQGPSSSLYGSEALAGVINLRTRKATEPLAGSGGWRHQTHGTTNWFGSLEGAGQDVSWRLNVDRLATRGYDLHPETPGLTSPGYTTITTSGKLEWQMGERQSARLGARFSTEEQVNRVGFDQGGLAFTFDQENSREDWSLAPEWSWQQRPGHSVTVRSYASSFRTRSELATGVDEQNLPEVTTSRFRQGLVKTEVQHDLLVGRHLILNSGTGLQRESVEADRIAGVSRSNRTAWAFSQQQFILGDHWQLTTSLRWDDHTDYGWQFSPKAAILVKLRETVRLRGSVGSGFKAPTFQQLYMDYTNPVAGYSVIGSTDARALLDGLVQGGQIQTVLMDPANFSSVTPESSVSFNVSGDTDLGRHLHLHIGLFRNHVQDLIETQPVAIKTNGQQVFSYVNLSRILTQGISSELRWRPILALEASLGYQYLDTRDLDVMASIDAGTVFGRENGRDYRLTRSDYGGLFGRSRHSGTMNLSWKLPDGATQLSLRGTWRSRFGHGDLNGNLILDADREYVDSHALWNVTLNRQLASRVQVQTGIINVMDRTLPERVPSLSGRQFFLTLSLSSH